MPNQKLKTPGTGKYQISVLALMIVVYLFPSFMYAQIAPLDQASFSSSSFLSEGTTHYDAQKAFDGSLETAWCEGVESDGEGEWLQVDFAEPVDLDGLLIYPGFHKRRDLFHKNSKPLILDIQINGGEPQPYSMRFFDYPTEYLDPESCGPGGSYSLGWSISSRISGQDASVYMAPRFLYFDKEYQVESLRISIRYTISGQKWLDTLITEIQLISRDLPMPEGGAIIPYLLALDRRIDLPIEPKGVSDVQESLDLRKSYDSFPIGMTMDRFTHERPPEGRSNRGGIEGFWEVYRKSFVGKTVLLPNIENSSLALGEIGFDLVDYMSGFSDTNAGETFFNYLQAFPLVSLDPMEKLYLNEAFSFNVSQ